MCVTSVVVLGTVDVAGTVPVPTCVEAQVVEPRLDASTSLGRVAVNPTRDGDNGPHGSSLRQQVRLETVVSRVTTVTLSNNLV